MKKRLFGLAVIAICLSVIGAGTLAFFTASDTAHNVITSGQVEINLIEQCVGDNGALVTFAKAHENSTITGVMPGREISKIVQVENTGLSKAWVRIKLEKSITAADGTTALNPDAMELDLSDEWVDGHNGYYYYKKPLDPKGIVPEVDETQQDAEEQPDETTATQMIITQTLPLFTKVTFASTMGNDYQGCTAVINVTAEATQYAHNDKVDSVLDVVGWPGQFGADEDGDDIIPPVNSDDNKTDDNKTENNEAGEGGNA